MPSTVPYGDPTAALPLAGRRENLTRRAFLEFADAVGLSTRAATSDLVRTLRRRRRDLGG